MGETRSSDSASAQNQLDSRPSRTRAFSSPNVVLRIVEAKCWKCGRPIKISFGLADEALLFGPEAFSAEMIEIARQQGAIIEYRYSLTVGSSYWANCCSQCRSIIGQFYIHDYADIDPIFEQRTGLGKVNLWDEDNEMPPTPSEQDAADALGNTIELDESSHLLYAPILKWKKGERVALEKMSEQAKTMIRPIIEVVSASDAEDFETSLSTCFSGPVYLDTIYEDDDNRTLLRDLISRSKAAGIRVCPVLYYADVVAADVAKWASEQDHVCVRIPVPEDVEGPDYAQVFSAIQKLRSSAQKIDLVFDLGPIQDKRSAKLHLIELTDLLTHHVIKKNIYSKLIVASTCFPESLALEAGDSKRFDRFELGLFRKLLTSEDLRLITPQLVFSDYGVTKFTEIELDFSRMRYGPLPKVRYTTKSNYWVLKGKKDRQNDVWEKSVFDMAKDVCESDDFYGESFSYGDREIKKRALNQGGPGNNADWVTFAVNHHLAVVITELSTLAWS